MYKCLIIFKYSSRCQLIRLKDLKSFCTVNGNNRLLKDVMLNEDEWASLERCAAALESFKIYSVKLQAQTCTLSDFFGFWMSLKVNLSSKTDDFSKELLAQMNKRHSLLMDNPILAAAVYLDPRYQRVMRDKKELAVEVLLNIHSRLKALQQNNDEIAPPSDCNDMDALLQQYLDSCDSEANGIQSVQNMKTIIENFYNLVTVPVQTPVLEFWKRMQLQMPELYKLAKTVMAIPPTQTTVERAFSALRILLTSQRTRTGDKLLQDMLLIRFNK